MRLLRYVGPGDDGEHVIVGIVGSADTGEQFQLHVDTALRDAINGDAISGDALPPADAPPAAPAPNSEPVMGPREIQVRVRGGESPQALAQATGMTIERVLRFAGPVIDERSRVADEARRARAQRSTAEGQIVVFGEAVDERFEAHGIDPAGVTWDARRREDGQWVVSAHWVGGDQARTAEWLFNMTARHVTPIDDTAADLLSDRPIRGVARPEAVRPKLTVAPPLRPGVVAFPPMPDADTGRLPRTDDVYDQEAADPDAPRVPSAEYHEPSLPLDGLPEPKPRRAQVTNLGIAHREDETDEERAARARIPSWDDILLGVRRKGEHPSR